MKCPICKVLNITEQLSDDKDSHHRYSCNNCGDFLISDEALESLKDDKQNIIKPKIAAFLRSYSIKRVKPPAIFLNDNRGVYKGSVITIDDIIRQFPVSISQRIDKVLINLSIMSEFMGQYFTIKDTDYPVLYVDRMNVDSIEFIYDLLIELKYIDVLNNLPNIVFDKKLQIGLSIRLSAHGWDRIFQLETSLAVSNNTFIAMSFNPSLEDVYKNAISSAVLYCGYTPVRVDKEEHNDKICDKIILEIRRSKFVICDFTEHKSGVYFEAGFALGLNIPVIWTCREDELKKTHFDTRQYNHIVWKTKEELFERLRDRIMATIQ